MRQITRLVVPTLAASVLLAACGSSASSTSGNSSSKPPALKTSRSSAAVVKTAANSTLGATVLVDAKGMTLYRLSGEHAGKWICTSTKCLQAWHPVMASAGGAPSASVGSLATVKRPGGQMQVTYKGMPLYTFVADQRPGEAKGQGIKDVGTWNAVTAGATSAAPAPASSSSTSSSGGYGY